MCPCKCSTLGKSRCNWWRWDESAWLSCALSFLWMVEGLWHRQKVSFLVVVRCYSCQRAGATFVLSGGDFSGAVRFSCSVLFSFERDPSKTSSECTPWGKALGSQARNLYTSAEVATSLRNECWAESLLMLSVGSEWHRGITEAAAEQKTWDD